MPPQKKLTKAEKLALKKEEEEKRRIEEELAQKQAEEEERQRLEQERLHQEELERIRCEEAEIRETQHAKLVPVFLSLEEAYKEGKIEEWIKLQWHRYVHVCKTIDPLIFPMVNAYLTNWEDDDNYDLKDFFEECHRCLKISEEIKDALLDCPQNDVKTKMTWKESVINLHHILAKKLDTVSYRLLKESNKYISLDSYNMEYGVSDMNFKKHSKDSCSTITLCLWANFVKNVRYKGMEMADLGYSFELPQALVAQDCAVRILFTLFDHVSPVFLEPELPKSEAAVGVVDKHSTEKVIPEDILIPDIQEPSEGEPEKMEDGSAVTIESEVMDDTSFPNLSSTEALPQSDSSEQMQENRSSTSISASATSLSSEEEVGKHASISFAPPEETEIGVVDPSEYFLVGGIFHFDLMKIPAQPVKVGGWILIHCEEEVLEKIPYKTSIVAIRQPKPDMSPAIAAEFADSEIKRFELEMFNAISVGISLPKSVIFLEQPIPAFWVPEKNGFTMRDFFEVQHEKENARLSFKTNHFGKIGLLQRKYANYPYQSWELKRGKKSNHAFLTVTGAIVAFEIEIRPRGCRLKGVRLGEKAIVRQFYDLWMSPSQLIRRLLSVGINIEVEEIGLKYTGVPSKHSELEEWTYMCMSILCHECTFTRSKWNCLVSNDQLVLKCSQPSESDTAKHTDSLILVSPERSVYLKCTDNDQEFSNEAVEGQEFCSDLYHLVTNKASETLMKKFEEISMHFSINMRLLLKSLKLLSCS